MKRLPKKHYREKHKRDEGGDMNEQIQQEDNAILHQKFI